MRDEGPDMTRCSCTACLLEAGVELLRSGRPRMAMLLFEQALEVEQAKKAETKVKPVVRPVTSTRKRGARRT
jgi:hypothetical protein